MQAPCKTNIASSSSAMQSQRQAPAIASDSASTSSNGTFSMGSVVGPKRFWRSRAATKTSLVQKFTQVVLKGSSTDVIQNEEPTGPTPRYNCTSLRERLEMDVERLHEKLQQEKELHTALENAIAHAAGTFSGLPQNLPVDAQELLADVAMLEVSVSSLEEQMIGLKMQIRQERGPLPTHCAASYALSPLLSPYKARETTYTTSPYRRKVDDPEGSFTYTTYPHEVKVSDPRGTNMDLSGGSESSHGSQPYISTTEITSLEDYVIRDHNQCFTGECTASDPAIEPLHEDSKNGPETCMLKKKNESDSVVINKHLPQTGQTLDDKKVFEMGTKLDDNNSSRMLWREPNRLSEEMVTCMIGIYCHLGDPSEIVSVRKHADSDAVPSPSSPFGQVASSSFSSFSDMSSWSFPRSPLHEPTQRIEQGKERTIVDPYSTYEKLAWGDISSYGFAVEVSWMSVGKEQLEYAADALRTFRCLVEQLSRVDIATMAHNEKLAFWINIYNALMMHAYLAYGVPKNEVKYFALMQKAAYTVGGHFFNAVGIEHVLLRGKAPSYRPQIALLLALHKLKIPEGATKFAISRPEPLVMFALSHGAWSSPAVRVYRADTVQAQLQAARHEYVRASVGVSRHGKAMVPKLLQCCARELGIIVHKAQRRGAEGGEEEGRMLINWICGFLPAQQAALLQDCVRNRSSSSSGAIAVQPFNSRLRYIFLAPAPSYHLLLS